MFALRNSSNSYQNLTVSPRLADPNHVQSLCARAQETLQLLSTRRTGLPPKGVEDTHSHRTSAIRRSRKLVKRAICRLSTRAFAQKPTKNAQSGGPHFATRQQGEATESSRLWGGRASVDCETSTSGAQSTKPGIIGLSRPLLQPPQPPSSLGYGVPFQGPVSKFDGPRETNCSS